ncbi:MAG: ATPase P [Desulfovibrionales bacterium]|nr:ATPase P [Desulfovibrionales bacterium]
MIELDIPGFGKLGLRYLVLDYNGTLALDGRVQPGVFSRLSQLTNLLSVHILTADTFGTVRVAFGQSDCIVHILQPGNEREAKVAYIRSLGAESCICLGNGNNDAAMLKEGGLSLAILQPEGVAQSALSAAHILVPGIEAGLDLLLHPNRLKATLRH